MKTFDVVKRGLLPIMAATMLLVACAGDEEPATPTSPPTSAPQAPLVEKVQVADWCAEHGVPESICTRCNATLIEGFKTNGDWCDTHKLPDSQCVTCNPELEAKFKAMAPKKEG